MTTEREPLERVTVNLIPQASRALAAAVERTGHSKTDTVNRAIQLYDFIVKTQADGNDVLLRAPGSDELEKIVLI